MAGVGTSLVIVGVATASTLLTGLSLSAIATNGAMKVRHATVFFLFQYPRTMWWCGPCYRIIGQTCLHQGASLSEAYGFWCPCFDPTWCACTVLCMASHVLLPMCIPCTSFALCYATCSAHVISRFSLCPHVVLLSFRLIPPPPARTSHSHRLVVISTSWSLLGLPSSRAPCYVTV